MRATKLSLDIHETVFDERLVHITNDRVNSTSKVRHHIFMITGNPGCIGYYHEFLTLLWNELGTLSKGTDLSVFGVSMSRFTDDGRRAVLGLQGQIDYLESRLREYIEQYVVIDSSVEHNVIIIGHSVGAYIGLELIRRHQDQSRKGSNRGFQVIGYVGLWPTVTHIAQSKRGRTVGWLLKLPFFALVISILVKIVIFIVGRSLIMLILKLDKFPEQSAEVTADFLASRNGVHQALHMAGDEMREIASDLWNEDIWGAESPPLGVPRPKVVLWFGRDDHWVADQCRDDLIKVRGSHDSKEDWRPVMVIDDTGIPHGFCINHSNVVARRTADWVCGMVRRNL